MDGEDAGELALGGAGDLAAVVDVLDAGGAHEGPEHRVEPEVLVEAVLVVVVGDLALVGRGRAPGAAVATALVLGGAERLDQAEPLVVGREVGGERGGHGDGGGVGEATGDTAVAGEEGGGGDGGGAVGNVAQVGVGLGGEPAGADGLGEAVDGEAEVLPGGLGALDEGVEDGAHDVNVLALLNVHVAREGQVGVERRGDAPLGCGPGGEDLGAGLAVADGAARAPGEEVALSGARGPAHGRVDDLGEGQRRLAKDEGLLDRRRRHVGRVAAGVGAGGGEPCSLDEAVGHGGEARDSGVLQEVGGGDASARSGQGDAGSAIHGDGEGVGGVGCGVGPAHARGPGHRGHVGPDAHDVAHAVGEAADAVAAADTGLVAGHVAGGGGVGPAGGLVGDVAANEARGDVGQRDGLARHAEVALDDEVGRHVGGHGEGRELGALVALAGPHEAVRRARVVHADDDVGAEAEVVAGLLVVRGDGVRASERNGGVGAVVGGGGEAAARLGGRVPVGDDGRHHLANGAGDVLGASHDADEVLLDLGAEEVGVGAGGLLHVAHPLAESQADTAVVRGVGADLVKHGGDKGGCADGGVGLELLVVGNAPGKGQADGVGERGDLAVGVGEGAAPAVNEGDGRVGQPGRPHCVSAGRAPEGYGVELPADREVGEDPSVGVGGRGAGPASGVHGPLRVRGRGLEAAPDLAESAGGAGAGVVGAGLGVEDARHDRRAWLHGAGGGGA
mmetsp:Transcript_59895/g.147240  ORF Transcript_59895/g.147240 Transcript_59895/m.147240 type:complete len:732 (+) Transcript_59895:2191-4386(+)